MSRLKDYWVEFRENIEFGYKIRKGIDRLSKKLNPYFKVLFPNFRVVHYFYIIFMCIIGSIIIYPKRNIEYIDALFFAVCSSTQAGLNTVNANDLTLYQQIVIYCVTMLTTPIFIHGSLLFVRLYYFERRFDNIKETSKLNFKMRRTATLAARTQSFDSTRANTMVNQNLGKTFSRRSFVPRFNQNINYQQHGSSRVDDERRDGPVSGNNQQPNGVYNDSDEISPKESGSSNITEGNTESISPKRVDNNSSPQNKSSEGIRFGNLPLPTEKRNKEVEPSDMYKSIAMLRNIHPTNTNDDDDVLVIKSPNEIERDSQKPIYTKRSQIQFSLQNEPLKRWKKKRLSRGSPSWSKLKRSFSNTTPHPRKSMRSFSIGSTTNDEDASFDSEEEESEEASDAGDSTNYEGDPENSDAIASDEESNSDLSSEALTDEETSKVHRAQSNLQLPSPDQTDGKKFHKRLNTLDAPPGDRSSFTKSPTFEKLIRSTLNHKRHKKNKVKKRRSLSKLSTSIFDNDNQLRNSTTDATDNRSLSKVMSTGYLSWNPTIGRNSNFVRMTDEQKEELGGVEYRAVKLLIKILVIYYIGFHVIAATFLLPYGILMHNYASVIEEQGITPTWWAFFSAMSSFNDLGYTLTPDSMMSFNRSVYVMVIVSFFVVIGNTGFPIMLRLIIWVLFHLSKPLSLFKESLGFLLDHPRRCFTLLFPSMPTLWLFSILVILNGVDLILFVILDIHSKFLDPYPTGIKVMQGLFQAFSTRTAGFSVFSLSNIHSAVQVSYLIMMYISVLPLAISIRRTNVYEEQSLGVYVHGKDEVSKHEDDNTQKNFIGAHLRRQLSFDLWFIFLGLFIICIAEGSKIKKDINFSIFAILFEIISAYGTVGLSLGYPNFDPSFSGKFTKISKLVIIAMMIRGRHRGLPYTLDRAVMLPNETMNRRDMAQENHDLRRHTTQDSTASPGLFKAISRRLSRYGTNDNRNTFSSVHQHPSDNYHQRQSEAVEMDHLDH
ncbi:Piso0_001379 [Millerozyma farinosa CBS 7064]|uniref:Potassium transport protein n=1 Tax=Pichia sorbitophila (strain ATCC MYA-4447 / BCRC 22081 / CBS 7064 / NBRC 10061 / NRRL Y-12695) TaxID=559304 RepID=G8YN04_PICSO|nr:Piso0_001379 [Millerozyma farinosa CBS 7064]